MKAVQLVFITVFVLSYSLLCAQGTPKRPVRGSIVFGKDKAPIEWNEEDIAPVRDVFYRIAKEVVPSVVSIVPTIVDTVIYQNPFYRFFGEDPFGLSPEDQQQEPRKQERRFQGLGSGVIVSSEGYILTNYHVVAGAQEIEIKLSDDRFFSAEIVGTDSLSDVAVVRITGKIPPNLPVAYLGNSDSLRPGDRIAAIGNPFSLTSTITSGIVSALGRRVEQNLTFQNFIQVDAAINPGNSGGALVNINGAVVGVNTLIFSQTGGFMGIGFAIPINMARKVMEDLIYEGEVVRGWVGLTVQDITPELHGALGLKSAGGVLVGDVIKDQPAQKAGIRAGDIIISIEGQQISNTNELINKISSYRPGTRILVTIVRDGKRMQLNVSVARRTPELSSNLEPRQQREWPRRGEVDNKMGIAVEPLTDALKERLRTGDINGVVVFRISSDITDERARLQAGDVITRIKVKDKTWTEILTVNDFLTFAKEVKTEQPIVLQINRQGNTFFISFSS